MGHPAWNIDHPLLNKLKPFKYASVQPLVDKVMQGDMQAREDLLKQLLAYVKTRLGRITQQESRLHRDFDALISHISMHLVELIYAVSQGKQVDNIVRYVSATLYIWCLRYLDTLLCFGKSRMKHLTGVAQEQYQLENLYTPDIDEALVDTLDSIARNDREREFIRLRAMGYRSYEIAEMLGISQVVVSKIRQVLIRRYEEETR